MRWRYHQDRGNMSFLGSIRLKNFKAFADTGTIRLRKLNLVVGKNSAGKSSILKAILASSQTCKEKKVEGSDLRLVGEHVDLGTFSEIIHNQASASQFSVCYGIHNPVEPFEERSPPDLLFEYKYKQGERLLTANISSIRVLQDDEILASAKGAFKNQDLFRTDGTILRNSKFASDIIQGENNLEEQIRNSFSSSESIMELGDTKHHLSIDDLVIEITGFIEAKRKNRPRVMIESPLFFNRSEKHQAINKGSKKLDKLLTNCVYIGPFREEPNRQGRKAILSSKSAGKKGHELAMQLHVKLQNKLFKAKFDKHLQKLKIADSITTNDSYVKVANTEKPTGYINILLEKSGGFYSLVDVGFGTSQVLPVVFDLMAHKEELILIEQPELHLHPSAQAELGDLLVDSVNQDNQLIVETHSVTLIERIRRLIRSGKIHNEDVGIIYVKQDGKSKEATCEQIGFLENSEFDKAWPEDAFFAEREIEAYSDWM